jgi:phosphoglycerate dehydrogenase-like enzyme
MPGPASAAATTVLVLDRFADEYARHLAAAFPSIEVHTAASTARIDVPLDRIDVLVAFGVAIDDALMRGLTRLAWIQSLATGVDHFLKSPGLKPETLLTSARGIHGAPMRETVALLLLGVTRNVRRLVENQHAKVWERGDPWPLLAGKTAIVVGSGVSGSAIGKLLQAFGMTTIVATRTPRPVDGFDRAIAVKDLAREVAAVDVLVDVLPGGPEHANTISRAVLEAMKPSAVFVNVGRGETVDEAALIDVLRLGRIAGAGLDVVARTPLDPKSPLWEMPNVLLSPHIGGYFAEYEEHMMPILLDNMRLFLEGRGAEMQNLVAH